MVTIVKAPNGVPSELVSGNDQFHNNLAALSKNNFGNKLIVAKDGKLVNTGEFSSLHQAVRGIFGLPNYASPRLVELKVIQFLDRGLKEGWINKSDLNQINALATRLGLVISDKASIRNHEELNQLIIAISNRANGAPTALNSNKLVEQFAKKYQTQLQPFPQDVLKVTAAYATHVKTPVLNLPVKQDKAQEEKDSKPGSQQEFSSKAQSQKDPNKGREEPSANPGTSTPKPISQHNWAPANVTKALSSSAALSDLKTALIKNLPVTLKANQIASANDIYLGAIIGANKSDALARWIKNSILVPAFGLEVSQVKQAQRDLNPEALVAKVGVNNAFVLLARGLQRAAAGAEIGNVHERNNARRAVEVFGKQIEALAIKYPNDVQRFDAKNLEFKKAELSATFLKLLEVEAKKAAQYDLAKKVAMGSVAAGSILAALYAWYNHSLPDVTEAVEKVAANAKAAGEKIVEKATEKSENVVGTGWTFPKTEAFDEWKTAASNHLESFSPYMTSTTGVVVLGAVGIASMGVAAKRNGLTVKTVADNASALKVKTLANIQAASAYVSNIWKRGKVEVDPEVGGNTGEGTAAKPPVRTRLMAAWNAAPGAVNDAITTGVRVVMFMPIEFVKAHVPAISMPAMPAKPAWVPGLPTVTWPTMPAVSMPAKPAWVPDMSTVTWPTMPTVTMPTKPAWLPDMPTMKSVTNSLTWGSSKTRSSSQDSHESLSTTTTARLKGTSGTFGESVTPPVTQYVKHTVDGIEHVIKIVYETAEKVAISVVVGDLVRQGIETVGIVDVALAGTAAVAFEEFVKTLKKPASEGEPSSESAKRTESKKKDKTPALPAADSITVTNNGAASTSTAPALPAPLKDSKDGKGVVRQSTMAIEGGGSTSTTFGGGNTTQLSLTDHHEENNDYVNQNQGQGGDVAVVLAGTTSTAATPSSAPSAKTGLFSLGKSTGNLFASASTKRVEGFANLKDTDKFALDNLASKHKGEEKGDLYNKNFLKMFSKEAVQNVKNLFTVIPTGNHEKTLTAIKEGKIEKEKFITPDQAHTAAALLKQYVADVVKQVEGFGTLLIEIGEIVEEDVQQVKTKVDAFLGGLEDKLRARVHAFLVNVLEIWNVLIEATDATGLQLEALVERFAGPFSHGLPALTGEELETRNAKMHKALTTLFTHREAILTNAAE